MSLLAKVVLVLAALLALAFAVGGWVFFKRPLTVDAAMSRLALRSEGLEEHRVDGPAGAVHVFEGGSGQTMILLHGAGAQAGNWARVAGVLAEGYHLVVPDLPGHGDSAPADGPIGVGDVLAAVAAVVEARGGAEPVLLVGNSLGAWVAMLYARDHPERVARVVAVNGGALLNPNPAVNVLPTTREEARATLQGLTGPATPMPPGFVLDDMVRHAREGSLARVAATAADMFNYLLDGSLDQVTVPVELVWGDADDLMTMEYAQRLLDGLPAARLHPVHGCGHVPQRECPDRFLEALEAALAQPPPEPSPQQAPELDVPAAEEADAAR